MLPLFNLFVQTAHAENPLTPNIAPVIPNSGGITPGDPVNFINTVYSQALNIITVLAGVIAVLFLIYYGIQYITSAGSADKSKAARSGIINAVVGIVVIIAAFAIIRLSTSLGKQLTSTTGIDTSTSSGGTTDTNAATGTGGTGQTGAGGTQGGTTNSSPVRTITFKVIDASGKPAKNISVSVSGEPSVTTDGNGVAKFTISSLNTTTYQVRAYQSNTSACSQTTSLGSTATVNLKLGTSQSANCGGSTPPISSLNSTSGNSLTGGSSTGGEGVEIGDAYTNEITKTHKWNFVVKRNGAVVPGAYVLIEGKNVGSTNSSGEIKNVSVDEVKDDQNRITEVSIYSEATIQPGQEQPYGCTTSIAPSFNGTITLNLGANVNSAECGPRIESMN